MPPKSASKVQKSQWHTCDQCEAKVHSNKLKHHETECSSTIQHGAINEKYYTSSINHSLPPEIDIKDAPSLFLQQFLFIPESICSFCNFTMGCNLLIEINTDTKYVMKSWTVGDKHLDEVFASSEGNILTKRSNLIRLNRLCLHFRSQG